MIFENKTAVWPFSARKSLLLLPRDLEDKNKCGIIHRVWYAEIGLIGTILGGSRVKSNIAVSKSSENPFFLFP